MSVICSAPTSGRNAKTDTDVKAAAPTMATGDRHRSVAYLATSNHSSSPPPSKMGVARTSQPAAHQRASTLPTTFALDSVHVSAAELASPLVRSVPSPSIAATRWLYVIVEPGGRNVMKSPTWIEE